MELFKNHLKKFWGQYHLFVWNHNCQFSSFHGNELSLWIKHIPATLALLRKKIENTEHVTNLCALLDTFQKLPEFWSITVIKNPEVYLNLISSYEDNVKTLYDIGAKTVLTDNTEGDAETLYFHVARFYIPKLARELFKKYGLGIGIYNMQGYEQRNKESKNTLRRFSNHKGNVVTPNLKRLWDIFHNSKNAF